MFRRKPGFDSNLGKTVGALPTFSQPCTSIPEPFNRINDTLARKIISGKGDLKSVVCQTWGLSQDLITGSLELPKQESSSTALSTSSLSAGNFLFFFFFFFNLFFFNRPEFPISEHDTTQIVGLCHQFICGLKNL